MLNTIILLASGFAVTYAHHSIIQGGRKGALNGLVITVILAFLFTTLQGKEYLISNFTFTDATYGSIFYFGTGFHGFHVIIGSAYIAVGL